MTPEFWVAVVAVFVSGGAVGASGTLLAQWLLAKLDDAPRARPRTRLGHSDLDLIRADLADLDRKLRNVDQRLDFQEELLGGGTPTRVPPPRILDGPREDVAAEE